MMLAWPHPTTRQVAWHEAGHVASLLLNDWPPVLVRVDNVPGEKLLGHLKVDWDNRDLNEASVRDLLDSVMQGPLSDGQPVHFDHDWPLDPDTWDDNRRDAQQIVLPDRVVEPRPRRIPDRRLPRGRERTPTPIQTMQVGVYTALVDREMLIQTELIELSKTVMSEHKET